MPLWRSFGARKDGTRGTAAIETRKSLEGLFASPGVVLGSAFPLVAGSAGWAYTVNAAHFVTKRSTGDGVHLFGNDGPVTVGAGGVGTTVTPAPGGGLSRVDIIWVRHRSADENGDTTSEPDFGVSVGTPGSPGLAPSIPAGALELARNTMVSGATSTASAGNTILNSAAGAMLRGQQAPGRSVRTTAATLAIGDWRVATDPLPYTFQYGGWYLITAVGSVSIGGSSATLTHRVRAAGLEVSTPRPVSMDPDVAYEITGQLLYWSTSGSTVQVMHEVFVNAPATGIVVNPGHAISIVRVA